MTLVDKWDKSGLLLGISNAKHKQLLSHYLQEGCDIRGIKYDPITGNIKFVKLKTKQTEWLLPLIRRIFKHRKKIDVVDLSEKLENYIGSPEMKHMKFILKQFNGIDVEVGLLIDFERKYLTGYYKK